MKDSTGHAASEAALNVGIDADIQSDVCILVADALGIRAQSLEPQTPLLGHVVELDSMAVVAIITALEDRYGFVVEDDELSSSVFETLESLARFVSEKNSL